MPDHQLNPMPPRHHTRVAQPYSVRGSNPLLHTDALTPLASRLPKPGFALAHPRRPPRAYQHSPGNPQNLIPRAIPILLCLAPLFLDLQTPLPAAAPSGAGLPPHPPIELQRHLVLPPGPGNQRNSEGDFIRLNDGRWLFIYTHFTSGAGDHAAACLASRESNDDGRTWSASDRVVVTNEGGFNVMSVSLVRLKSGGIGLFYLRKNSLQDCRPLLRLSRDEARTWSRPIECVTDELGYYVLNNNRVIQLENGRLVLPAALHQYLNGRIQPGKVVVYLSDDEGKHWRRSPTVLDRDTSGARVNFMEPGVVETRSNHLFMVIRTKLGCQYTSASADGGETWQTPTPSGILGPEAPATVTRIPSTGDLLLIWNDHCNQPEAYRRAQPPLRAPLAAALSHDGGRTWAGARLLETQSGHGYCYVAVALAGDRVLLGYCAHPSPYGLETTRISSFRLADLYQPGPETPH